ncbi:carcinoembryonic antigen-related cell adhesion molecule 1 [Scomber scombrus]|uniref:Carcinoembryonic antigen-related cell adhesion molecule 1 n=1 Tax=Scomber scombrus TaxID=13677 RepID=A0AAV1P406_SCOSC
MGCTVPLSPFLSIIDSTVMHLELENTSDEMETAVTHFILLAVISGLTKGHGVLPDELTANVVEEVTFTTTVNPPETPFLTVNWNFFPNSTYFKSIITSTSSDIIGPEYEGRITFNRSTGSLKLMDLTLHDRGEYRVTIITVGGQSITGSTKLAIRGEQIFHMILVLNAEGRT